jgi:hypothetical protein
MDKDQIAAIVKGLTKGQAKAIIDAIERPAPAYVITFWEIRGRSANSLSLKGLAVGRDLQSLSGRRRRALVLTPLGLAVRQYLLGTPEDV